MYLVRVMGDPHGFVDLEEDGHWFSQADLSLCTGDFGYKVQGRERDFARHVMAAFADLKVATVLGNHDGICHHPSLVYRAGETEPACQEELIQNLGDFYLGYRRLDFEAFSLVGGRPFSNGNPGIHHPPWGFQNIDVSSSAEKILGLIKESPNKNILILSHNGPRGLGGDRDSIFGRDWKKPPEDWGDEDLEIVLNNFPKDKKIMAVVAGHMHHSLRGSGLRRRVDFFKEIPVINCAVVPRVMKKGPLSTRSFNGDVIEKKIFQEHRHFVDLEIDLDQGCLVRARDFWARSGSREADGVRLTLWEGEDDC